MEVQPLHSDIISTLPHDIIEMILTLLPIREALRMSILSRKWRYCWASIPELVFDNKFFEGSSFNTKVRKQKIANSILRVLQLHMGSIVKFILYIELEMVNEIDQIILHLSSSNTLKHFSLVNHVSILYRLPSSFYSLQGLEHMEIWNCNFKSPISFNVFSTVTWLCLSSVKISAKMLKLVLTSCLLLKEFYLVGYSEYITGGNKFTIMDLFECLPSIISLGISANFFNYFTAGGIPCKLPVSLHIVQLILGMCFTEQDELSLTLSLIKNSPNLVKLYLMSRPGPTPKIFPHLQEYPDFKLNHLKELEMVSYNNLPIETEFVKHVMAKSHVLKKVRIELNDNISVDEELKMLKDLILLPFTRASPSAKLIVERSKTSPDS